MKTSVVLVFLVVVSIVKEISVEVNDPPTHTWIPTNEYLSVCPHHLPNVEPVPEDIPNRASNIDPRHTDSVAFIGDPLKHYYLLLREMNNGMRDGYKEYIRRVGRNVFPLIIANDAEPGYAGIGSTFTLYLEGGTMHRIVPTGPNYEMYKTLSHIPLTLFILISPYFKTPESTKWQKKMKNHLNDVEEVINALDLIEDETSITKESKETARTMLTMGIGYMKKCLEKKYLALEDFVDFGNEIYPYVKTNIETASRMQVFAAIPQLQKWKDELGEKWKDLYVVIPTVWTVSERNTRQQIFESLMDKDKISTHIIKAEGARDVEEARDLLGRLVSDNFLAKAVFGSHTEERKQLLTAISSRVDLMTPGCHKAIHEYFGRSCKK